MGELTGVFKSLSGFSCKEKKILNSIDVNKGSECITYDKELGARPQVQVKGGPRSLLLSVEACSRGGRRAAAAPAIS